LRDGPWKFSVRYLWQLVTKGYRKIDYEIEAEAVSGPISLYPMRCQSCGDTIVDDECECTRPVEPDA
jgi:hypothetical protein